MSINSENLQRERFHQEKYIFTFFLEFQLFMFIVRKFDSELESFLTKRKAGSHSRPPIHICARLELNKHEKELQLQDENFGIVGLHSCGNLGPVIIHNYVNSPAKFALSVGCCWQKMDGNG